jgi:hypothetical protein
VLEGMVAEYGQEDGLQAVLWSRSRKEPKLLAEARAGAGAGILKFQLWLPAPGQTKVVY